MGLRREFLTGEPTLPDWAGADKTVPEMQRMKPRGIQHLIPVAGGEDRGRNVPTIDSFQTPKTRRNRNTRQDPDPT